MEARGRQVFDPEQKIYDERKRRVTDLKECNRVTLPRPLGVQRKAQIETRREIHRKIFLQYKKEKSTEEGEQVQNLREAASGAVPSLCSYKS